MTDQLRTKANLKTYFETNDIPTQSQFDDLITTMVVEGGDSGTTEGAIRVGNTVSATNTASFALGIDATASAEGAWAIGSNVVASNTYSMVFGRDAINDQEYSLQMGANGIRILGSTPSTLRDGDIWVDSDVIKARSNSNSLHLGSLYVDVGNVSSNVYTNVTTGDIFELTLVGNIYLDNPTNGIGGESVTWLMKQSNVGSNTVTLGSKFIIPASALPPLDFSTTVGLTDIFVAEYNAKYDKWMVLSMIPGYTF